MKRRPFRDPDDDLVVCLCPSPDPDPLGQCSHCWRLVVTYAHAYPERFRTRWPEEWQRALDLGVFRP